MSRKLLDVPLVIFAVWAGFVIMDIVSALPLSLAVIVLVVLSIALGLVADHLISSVGRLLRRIFSD